MLLQIMKMDPDAVDMADGIIGLSVLRGVMAEYGLQHLPVPEDVQDKFDSLQREVSSKRRDYLQAQLKAANLKLDRLKTPDQQRRDTQAEIERLQRQINDPAYTAGHFG